MGIDELKFTIAQTACLHQVVVDKFLVDLVFTIVFCITNFFVEGLYYNMVAFCSKDLLGYLYCISSYSRLRSLLVLESLCFLICTKLSCPV